LKGSLGVHPCGWQRRNAATSRLSTVTVDKLRSFRAVLIAMVVVCSLAAMFWGPTERAKVVGTTLVFGSLALSLWRDIFTWVRRGDVVVRRYSIRRKAQPLSYGAALLLFMFIALLFSWGTFRAALFALEMFGLLS